MSEMNTRIVTSVKPGETLSGIAARHGVGVDDLQRWNGIEDPDLVLAGQKIIVHHAAQASVVENVELWAPFDSPAAGRSQQDIAVGGAIVLGLLLLLLLLRRRRLRRRRLRRPPVNAGERLVSSGLRQRYRDWILIDDIMLPSGPGTTQIDHVLVSPSAVFIIETKDMNAWVFGAPGDKQWTLAYKNEDEVESRKFRIYNPLRQNQGHARVIDGLRVVESRRIRPVVVFVGDAELKTAGKFLSFHEHEAIASRDGTGWMRGVVCMSLAELHRYIDLSVDAFSGPDLTRRQMEAIRDRIGARAIPITFESYERHVAFVRSLREADRV